MKKILLGICLSTIIVIFAPTVYGIEDSNANDAGVGMPASVNEQNEEVINYAPNSWVTNDSGTFYINQYGNKSKGVVEISSVLYYFDEVSGALKQGAGWVEYKGNRYYSNEKGVLYRNRHIHFGYHDDYVLRADGSVVRGLFYEGNNRYYADINTGEIRKEARWIEYNGNRYFSNSEGVLYRNRHIHFGYHDDYVMSADGSVVRGLFYEGNNRYYADINTGEIRKEARWIEYNGNRYFSNSEGVLYRNRHIHFGYHDDYVMSADGSVVRGLFYEGNNRYYADINTGEIKKEARWIEYNGNRYFSNSEGVLYRNRHIHFGYHDDYVMSADGSVVRGLFYEGNNRYYADINTGEIKKEARWIEYNGNRYFSNSEGVLYRNRHIHFGHHDDYIMRADGSVLRGFFYEGTDRYYADINTGEIRKEARWIEHDGNRYFSNSEGVLYRNRFIHFSTKSKYYMTSDGSVARTRFVLDNITYVPDSVTGEIMISPENQEGWFHKDGNKYYRNSDGSLATGYKDIEGFKYYFDDNGILKSKVVIDVSQWQNRINWSEVAKTPVSAAIIRSSYTGAASGKIVEDPNYRQNIAGAIEAGIEVGVYHYSQAITVEEAREEARKIFELSRGYNLTLPIFMDIEYYHDSGGYGRNYYITKQERTNIIKAFCDEVIRLGGKPVIYSYTSFLENEIYMGQLQNYPVWVAQYYHKVTYSGPFIGWQYSSKGRVNGINGDVDLNLFFTK